MEIINGHGKLDKRGKYIVSALDRKESNQLIKVMFSQVDKIIVEKFGSSIYSEEHPKPYYFKAVEQATGYLWTPSIKVDGPNFKSDKQAFIHIDTGINTNGYDNDTIKRHFVISFELKGAIRYKFCKRWDNDSVIIKKYVLADNMDEAINEFKFFLNTKFDAFFTNRMLKNLEYNR